MLSTCDAMQMNKLGLPKLIGIAGKKGAGKDTVANHLVDIFGYRKLAFADPIKKGLAAMFDLPIAMFDDPATKETPQDRFMGRSPRYLMQTLGTEWGRDMVRSDLWVSLALQQVQNLAKYGIEHVVISDVRFDGEAEAIIAAGGIVWFVDRHEDLYSAGDTHRSEASISPSFIDCRLYNDTTLELLYAQIGVAIANATRKLYRPDPSTAV